MCLVDKIAAQPTPDAAGQALYCRWRRENATPTRNPSWYTLTFEDRSAWIALAQTLRKESA